MIKRADPPRPADNLGVQANRQHPRRPRTFSIKSIERVAAISGEVAPRKHRASPETEVVQIHRVGHDEKRPAFDILKVRNVVIHRRGIIEKPLLRQDAAGCDRLRHAIEPADNRPADDAGEGVTRLAYLLAFLRLGKSEMIDPAVAVADDVVAVLYKFRCHRWIALKGKRTRKDCRPDLILIEEIDAAV